MGGMSELVGERCAVVFNLPALEWPIRGFPAFVTVEAIDMPMIKLLGTWYNLSIVKSIGAS